MGFDIREIGLVIIAAGRSTRMGQSKGLLIYHSKLWINEQLSRFAAAGGKKAVLVVGDDHNDYRHALELNSEDPVEFKQNGLDITLARSPAPALGPLLSLQTGIACHDMDELTSVLLLPIDVPLLKPTHLNQFISSAPPTSLVSKPTFQGVSGHPVLLAPDFCKELMQYDIDSSMRLDRIVESLPPETVSRIPVQDDAILKNLNTRAEWDKFSET